MADYTSGLPRRDRASCDYEAYVPDLLVGRPVRLDGDVAADVADAEAAVTRFDAKAVALADTEALARLLLRAESVASSKIEGLEVGGRRLLRAEAATALGEDATRRDRDRGARQHPGDDVGARRRRAAATTSPSTICSKRTAASSTARACRSSGEDPRGPELDRREQLQPVLGGVRDAAAGAGARSPG